VILQGLNKIFKLSEILKIKASEKFEEKREFKMPSKQNVVLKTLKSNALTIQHWLES